MKEWMIWPVVAALIAIVLWWYQSVPSHYSVRESLRKCEETLNKNEKCVLSFSKVDK